MMLIGASDEDMLISVSLDSNHQQTYFVVNVVGITAGTLMSYNECLLSEQVVGGFIEPSLAHSCT